MSAVQFSPSHQLPAISWEKLPDDPVDDNLSVQPIAEGEIRRSYTPHAEGDVPAIVMEFISETEGGEYS